MTTAVKVLIEGNKACEVQVIEADGSASGFQPVKTVKPGEFASMYIHGEQVLLVKEVGDFLT